MSAPTKTYSGPNGSRAYKVATSPSTSTPSTPNLVAPEPTNDELRVSYGKFGKLALIALTTLVIFHISESREYAAVRGKNAAIMDRSEVKSTEMEAMAESEHGHESKATSTDTTLADTTDVSGSSSLLVKGTIGHMQNTDVDEISLMSVSTSHSSKKKDCRVHPIDPGMGLCHYIPGHGKNFGDAIGPDVVKELLRSHFDCPLVDMDVRGLGRGKGKPCFVSVGSVFHMIKPGDTVWATGVNNIHGATVQPATPIYAVRGPLTKRYLGKLFNQSSVAYGDPGFLVPYLFPEFENAGTQTPPQQSLPRHCLVPHYHDLPSVKIIQRGLNVSLNIITPRDDWQVVVHKLATQCDYVASSSLHGLILADSLGLPVMWWQSDKSKVAKSEGLFKYLDYFGGFVAAERRRVKKPEKNWRKFADTAVYLPPIPKADRDAYAKSLIQTFPFHLFAVKQ